MAHTQSAKKRIRQTIKRTAINRSIMSRVRTLRKKVAEAVETKDAAAAAVAYNNFASAIDKAAKMYPDYDDMVGKGFGVLRGLELDGCKDARMMGLRFGDGLTGALKDIAGDHASDELDTVFRELTAAVYVMDAIDDLDDDFMDNTYNPFLPETGYINAKTFISSNAYQLAGIMNETMSSLQGAYSSIRSSMYGNVSLCDNIVYFGIPESAKKVMTGDADAKASIKNILSKRKERLNGLADK